MTCNDTHDTFDCDYKYLLSASCDLILQVLLPCTKLYLKLLAIQNDKNDLKSSWQMMLLLSFQCDSLQFFFDQNRFPLREFFTKTKSQTDPTSSFPAEFSSSSRRFESRIVFVSLALVQFLDLGIDKLKHSELPCF